MGDTNKLGVFITEEKFNELKTKAIHKHLDDLNKFGEENGKDCPDMLFMMMITAAGTGICRELANLIFNKEGE